MEGAWRARGGRVGNAWRARSSALSGEKGKMGEEQSGFGRGANTIWMR